MCVFVGGGHGVGKSWLCAQAEAELNVRHVSASSLIREARSEGANWNVEKRTQNVRDNQKVLVNAVRELAVVTSVPLILDGHFVLVDSKGTFITVPEQTFRDLQVEAIILIEAVKTTVLERYKRRGVISSLNEISEQLNAEHEHAKNVSDRLNIPLNVLFEPTVELFLEIVKEHC